ncbi:MAG TPA: RNA-binding domain-containing protein [Bacteroidales bacterium]|nr:RNA-binding domain-containing protein [Bacteroidales bacterium]
MGEAKITRDELIAKLTSLESELIERTISINNTDKFAQAICAFSNDLPNHKQKGYLLIGVKDNGELSGLKADDKLLQNLGGFRSDGNILPQPIISVKTFTFEEGDVVVVEITPSPFPPVRYKGKTWIRVGARKAIASEMEERVLIERRSSNVSMFDMRPCIDSCLKDLNLDLFVDIYLPKAIDKDVLKNDNRNIKEKLAALRFYNILYDKPTNAGVLLFGKNPEYFIPGAYIQYVEFSGNTISGKILNEKKFSGALVTNLKKIEGFIDDAIITQRPVPFSTLQEITKKNYPNWAIRELMMNAVMHRDYESNAPIKFYQYSNGLQIANAGGLYGKARPENFPNENDYRNPVIAEAMKILGYVNRFNRGIELVKVQLAENGNPEPVFDYDKVTSFAVSVREPVQGDEMQENEVISKEDDCSLSKYGRNAEEIRKKYGRNAEEILKIIIKNPESTTQIMAEQMNVSVSTIEKNIAKLKKAGIIERVGSTKSGYWEIVTS